MVRKPDIGLKLDEPFELANPRALMDGNNFRIRPGRIEKTKGWTPFSATVLPGQIMLVDVARYYSGVQVLIVADTKRVYAYNTSTLVLDDITGANLTASAVRPHFSGMWKNYLIYTNTIDVVKKWQNSGNIATLGGLTDAEPGGVAVTAVKTLCPAGPFLLLGNTTEGGSAQPLRVRWNALGILETWKNDADGNGQAGFMDVDQEPSEIKNIVPIGNYFAVYKEKSVHLLTYVGLPFIWALRQVVSNRGLISPKAIVSLGDFHVAAFTDNFYVFNGATLTPIGAPIRDVFFASLNPNAKDLMFAYHLEDKAEVVFAYPSLASTTPDKAVVYNYLLNAWSFRDFPFLSGSAYLTQSNTTWTNAVGTWDTQTLNWNYRNFASNAPLPIVGDAVSKKIFTYDVNDDANGANISAYVTSVFSDMGAPDRIKRLLRIKPICAKLNVDMTIAVITADNSRGDTTEQAAMAYNPSTDEFVDVDYAARFFALKFASPLKNQPFIISGWVAEFEMQEDR